MAHNKTVLVLTQQLDFHADLVIAELNKRSVPVVRFDTADFPLRATLIAQSKAGSWDGAIVTEHRTVAFEQIGSIWYRRPTPFELDPTLSPSGQQFASAEARMALGGLLRSLDCLWVNHPEKMVSADYKPFQLKVAGECGLEIPASLITNDPEAVLDFFERCNGEMIYKTLSGGMIVAESGEVVSVYTSRVMLDDLRDEGSRVRYTACLFQQLVPKKVELRITVVGERVFPAAISYMHPERAAIDWRTSYQDLRYGIHELPHEIRHQCLKLVRKLGLSFAAIDMIVRPDDRYVFLEVNPNGQWQWIERATGFPICETLVDLLVAGKTGQGRSACTEHGIV
jgi:ATP-grasp ribosomal peptide maturase